MRRTRVKFFTHDIVRDARRTGFFAVYANYMDIFYQRSMEKDMETIGSGSVACLQPESH